MSRQGHSRRAVIVREIETMYVNADTSERYLRNGVLLPRANGDSLAVYLGMYELASLYFHKIGQTSKAEEFMLLAMPGILNSECTSIISYAHRPCTITTGGRYTLMINMPNWPYMSPSTIESDSLILTSRYFSLAGGGFVGWVYSN